MSSPLRTLDRPRYDGGQPEQSTSESTPLRGRRSIGRMLFGLLLAIVLVLVFVSFALRADHKQPVLAVARSVAAGQQLTAADLRTVRVAVEAGVAVVPAVQADQILGRTATVPLTAGALLAPGQVGPPAWPPAGQAVVALPVKAGHAPAGLAAGATVMVVVTPTGAPAAGSGKDKSTAPGTEQAPATVVAVTPTGDQSGAATVSLLVTQQAGVRLAAASGGDVSIVLLAPQR